MAAIGHTGVARTNRRQESGRRALAIALAAPARAIDVLSGQTVDLQEVLVEELGGETWLRFRFIAPQIAKGPGAIAYDRAARKMRSVFAKGEEERRLDRDRLETLRAKILAAVPGVGIASDQDYRVADLAVDFCEDVAPLDDAAVARIVDMFVAAGATAKVSSIHVNGWFGNYDKLTMAERCLREVAGIDMTADNERIVFAGDSPNDAPMFGFFQHSVGVANVRRFELPHQPSWITQGESADGFCQLANALVEARR